MTVVSLWNASVGVRLVQSTSGNSKRRPPLVDVSGFGDLLHVCMEGFYYERWAWLPPAGGPASMGMSLPRLKRKSGRRADVLAPLSEGQGARNCLSRTSWLRIAGSDFSSQRSLLIVRGIRGGEIDHRLLDRLFMQGLPDPLPQQPEFTHLAGVGLTDDRGP
ncbi:hypothetical protein R1flu_023031 [Riccia fluitans]|uniref:Uncharacterized protein n=1 Tax=Riccia fluitans TaxID=41844 RepID=A0ABD1XRE0_9MARC